ncbi:MAG: hypothetical protein EA376_05055 [Phycisphaeraceae bacterium]|nr:MAG: hypothetical protein EA376_05055 [Phycisphaeraceae bacterium]
MKHQSILRVLMFAAPAATALAAAAAATTAQPAHIVIYAFDQRDDLIIRVEDKNGDGSTTGPGEVTLFFDSTVPDTGVFNAQGMLALDVDKLLATDNFDPEKVVLLQDLNGDGSAFGPGESLVWFDGRIPGDLTIDNPVDIKFGPGGAIYLFDNNTLSDTTPEAIYRLEDINGDGVVDIDTPGEVTKFFELSPIGSSFGATCFSLEFDAAGFCYAYDISDPEERIHRITPDGSSSSVFLTSQTLFNLTNTLFFSGARKMAHNPHTDEIIITASEWPGSRQRFIALRDQSGSGTINSPSEIRTLWRSEFNADGVIGFPRDFVYIPEDGSIIFVDSGRNQIVRLFDIDGNGDYLGPGETTVLYNADDAAMAGQVAATLMLSVAAAVVTTPPCPADLSGDGSVGSADLAILLGCWGKVSGACAGADLTGDTLVGSADLAFLLGNWGPCPD